MRWSGFQGAPGYSNFYFSDESFPDPTVDNVNEAIARVEDFAQAIKNMIPGGSSLLVEPDAEVIRVTDGEILNVVSGTAVPSVASVSLNSIKYAAGTGAVITWRTAGVRRGRRVRGRTFLVPFHSEVMQNDGTIDNGFVTGIGNAATALRTPQAGVQMGVWARPSGPGATDGDFFPITAHSVPDKVAILKSRRD